MTCKLRDKRIALNTLTVELHAVEAAMTIVLSFLFGEREIENPQYLESCHYQLQKIATYLETEMTKTRTELQNTNPEA